MQKVLALEIDLPNNHRLVFAGYDQDLSSLGYLFLMCEEGLAAVECPALRIDIHRMLAGTRTVLQEGPEFSDDAAQRIVARMEGEMAFHNAKEGGIFALQSERERYSERLRSERTKDSLRL
ncbi:MAG: hypothetical protein QY311_02570 [Candidatus Paceibacterota bacterium]|nr:MAG: hypothetical protein QY311_02570 [Candidatus Paceibacterota bacterium]